MFVLGQMSGLNALSTYIVLKKNKLSVLSFFVPRTSCASFDLHCGDFCTEREVTLCAVLRICLRPPFHDIICQTNKYFCVVNVNLHTFNILSQSSRWQDTIHCIHLMQAAAECWLVFEHSRSALDKLGFTQLNFVDSTCTQFNKYEV